MDKTEPSCSNPRCATLCTLSLELHSGGEVRLGAVSELKALSFQPFATLFSHVRTAVRCYCWKPHELFSSPGCDRTLVVAADGNKSLFCLMVEEGHGPSWLGVARLLVTLCLWSGNRDKEFFLFKIKSVTLVVMLPTFRLGLPTAGRPITDLPRVFLLRDSKFHILTW